MVIKYSDEDFIASSYGIFFWKRIEVGKRFHSLSFNMKKAVIAHELGHCEKFHIELRILCFIFCFPALLWLCRKQELEADAFAAKLGYAPELRELLKNEWDGFLGFCCDDKPIDTVVKWVRRLSLEYIVVIVSGRPMDKCGLMTREWMRREDVQIPYHRMFMRRGGDKRSDVEVKNEILGYILKWIRKDQIWGVIDDRPRVVEEVWRAAGLHVYPVGMRDGDW